MGWLIAGCDDDPSTTSASSSSGVTSATNSSSTAATSSSTSSSTSGTGGAGGGDALCAERTDGALVDFTIVAESLRLWITNDAFIDESIAQLAGDVQPRVPLFNDLVDGQDCDPQWSWHVDPQTVEFADFTIELCDGLPSHIEADKQYWLNTVSSYCPWSAVVAAVDDRRTP